MSESGLDRRARRRHETIEEILEVAVRLMETEGVAALSLSAVARQLGMQPPSLYQYFPSKLALYDALLQRGGEEVIEASRIAYDAAATDDPLELDLVAATAFCRWCMEHPIHAQLMFWRTIPGFEPTPEAFAAVQQSRRDLATHLQNLVDTGRLHPDAAGEEGIALYTSLLSGLLSQQMAIEPGASFEDGRYMRLLPVVLDMFYQRYPPSKT
jgi:AcrR family transcriptional regulator